MALQSLYHFGHSFLAPFRHKFIIIIIIHNNKIIIKKIYKAKQIILIVSQAFFLGKPMRDAAFFLCVCANHNHN